MSEEDILVYPKSKPNCFAQTSGMITVVLDTDLTPELIMEGNAREFISKIQNMRKEAGFEVEDRIKVSFTTTEELKQQILSMSKMISEAVLANEILIDDNFGFIKETDINGVECKICISKE